MSSKEALAAEASAAGLARSNAGLADALERKKGKAWRRYVDDYLSTEHRDHPASGCTVAALAADAARQGKEVQARFAEGLEGFIESLAAHLAEATPGEPAATREQSVRRWSEMVGALVLSRAVAEADPALSKEILEASRRRVA